MRGGGGGEGGREGESVCEGETQTYRVSVSGVSLGVTERGGSEFRHLRR